MLLLTTVQPINYISGAAEIPPKLTKFIDLWDSGSNCYFHAPEIYEIFKIKSQLI